jgi:hypothetical protein
MADCAAIPPSLEWAETHLHLVPLREREKEGERGEERERGVVQ